MLVYVAREWAKVSVKEISRRLHRDPSIISRLYAAYALASKLGGDLTSPPYRTLPRERLCPPVGHVEFSKLIRHRCADCWTLTLAVNQTINPAQTSFSFNFSLLGLGSQRKSTL